VLVVVDPQKAFGSVVSVPHVEEAVSNMRKVISYWRKRGGKVILTRHIYKDESCVGSVSDFIPPIFGVLREGSPMGEFHDGIWFDGVIIIDKTEFNAFIGTTLEKQLRKLGASHFLVCGLTTPICVEGTARGGVERGFKVTVVSDACASQPMGEESAREAHDSAIVRLGYIFAKVVSTEDLLSLQ